MNRLLLIVSTVILFNLTANATSIQVKPECLTKGTIAGVEGVNAKNISDQYLLGDMSKYCCSNKGEIKRINSKLKQVVCQ